MTKSIALFTQGKSLEWFCAEENFLAVPLQKARFIDWEWQVIFLFEICKYKNTTLTDRMCEAQSYSFSQLNR